MNAGPSASSLPKKLGITGDIVFTVRRAPQGFAAQLEADGGVGNAVWQQSLMAPLDLVIAFHTNRELLTGELGRLLEPLHPDGAVWIAWPKPTSGVTTDITDEGLRKALSKLGWDDDKTCGIDETWSAVRFVRRKQNLRPKDNARAAKRGR